MSTQMRSAAIYGYGEPEAIVIRSTDRPVAGSGEVVVRNRVAAVNAIDCKTRAGRGVPLAQFPAGLGWDLAGEVIQVGREVDGLREGDRVFGMARFPEPVGAYAEYVVAPAAALAGCPAGVDLRVLGAAAMPALTAWQALAPDAGSLAGRRVLVHGAAGGVGHLAVQLARWVGAYVTATASPANHSFLKRIGAETTLDYAAIPFEKLVAEIDVAIDTRGGRDFEALLATLRPGGLIVSLVGPNAAAKAPVVRDRMLTCRFPVVRPDGLVLSRVAELVANRQIEIEIEQEFPLAAAPAAHRLVGAGHVRGRVLIRADI